MTRFQRKNAHSNTRVGRDFEDLALDILSPMIHGLEKNLSIPIGFYLKKKHAFDLGSLPEKTIVECKSHTWTESGNVPSAKLTTWDQAMLYFYLAPRSFRKVFIARRDVRPSTGMTLCEYYLRTHCHVIPDEVEFWELDEQRKKLERVDFDVLEQGDNSPSSASRGV